MLFFLAQVGVIDPRKPPAGWYVRICTGRVADNLEIKLEIDFDFFSVDFLCHMSFCQLLHSSVRPRCCGWADESSSPFDLWSIFCVFFWSLLSFLSSYHLLKIYFLLLLLIFGWSVSDHQRHFYISSSLDWHPIVVVTVVLRLAVTGVCPTVAGKKRWWRRWQG